MAGLGNTPLQTGERNMVDHLNAKFDFINGSDVSQTNLTPASGWQVNSAWYAIKNGILFINIRGLRPATNTTGSYYYTVMTLPSSVYSLIPVDVAFVWSSYSGGGARYSGNINSTNGEVQLQLAPSSDTLINTHRFSIFQAIPLL